MEAVWLTGVPWQEDVGEIQWRGQQLASVTPLIGSATPSIRGMGNFTDTLPVPVSLSFADDLSALRYCAEVLWILPRHGELVFIDQRDSAMLTITYPRAAFQNVDRKRIGTAVDLLFTFVVKGPPAFELVSDAPARIYTESGTPITTE